MGEVETTNQVKISPICHYKRMCMGPKPCQMHCGPASKLALPRQNILSGYQTVCVYMLCAIRARLWHQSFQINTNSTVALTTNGAMVKHCTTTGHGGETGRTQASRVGGRVSECLWVVPQAQPDHDLFGMCFVPALILRCNSPKQRQDVVAEPVESSSCV